MSGALIQNFSTDSFPLPYPLGGILGGGQGTIVAASAKQLATYGIQSNDTIRVTDLGPAYVGPYTAGAWQGNLPVTDLYLNSTTGSDSNTGAGGYSNAWKTLTPFLAYLKLFPRIAPNSRLCVHMQGTFTMPVTNSDTDATGYNFIPCPEWNPLGEPLTFIGEDQPTDSGLGTRTAGSVTTTTRAGLTVSSIPDNASTPYTASTLKGARIRVLDGAGGGTAAGKCATIEDNSTQNLFLASHMTGLLAGDHYVIERSTTQISWPTSGTQFGFGFACAGAMGGAMFYGIKFDLTSSITDMYLSGASRDGTCFQFGFCEANLSGARLRASGCTVSMSCAYFLWTTLFEEPTAWFTPPQPSNGPVLANQVADGFYIHDSNNGGGGLMLVGARVASEATVFSNCDVASYKGCFYYFSTMAFHFPTAWQSNPVVEVGGADGSAMLPPSEGSAWLWAYPNGNGPLVQVDDRSGFTILGAQAVSSTYGAFAGDMTVFKNNAGGSVSAVTNGSGTITANNAVAVHVESGARVVATDANVGSTAAGTGSGGGAVKVGGNTVDTWANIAAGLTAHVSDLGATSTQMCYLGIAT
jgi:hypothetical protein